MTSGSTGISPQRIPENVAAVAIRRLTPGEAVLAGGRSGARDHRPDAVPWLYADDGAGLIEQLERSACSRWRRLSVDILTP